MPERRRRHRSRPGRALVRDRRWRSVVSAGLRHPLFPRTFLARNVRVLEQEERWKAAPVRIKRVLARRLLLERCRFFNEVVGRLQARLELPSFGPRSRRSEIRPGFSVFRQPGDDLLGQAGSGDSFRFSGYCDHCGGCCEIASGYPDFPDSGVLPLSWQRAFGDGLGRNHRFCPFLWEIAGSGWSVCAIHPWRPNPCRIFEQDECRRLKSEWKDPAVLDRIGPATHELQIYRLLVGR